MIEEIAVVNRISKRSMELRIERPQQCDGCAVRENCYTQGNVLTVPLEPGVRESDRVRLTITNTSVLGLSALMYGVPLVAVLAGIILGYYLFFPSLAETARTLATMGSGFGLMAVAALVVHHAGKRVAGSIEYATERIGESDQSDESLSAVEKH